MLKLRPRTWRLLFKPALEICCGACHLLLAEPLTFLRGEIEDEDDILRVRLTLGAV